ncbi:MAG: hypothetical protein K0R31_426 [Clostridiales bacterium]|nr:hypothetical protein [Clostridiales bacterium]
MKSFKKLAAIITAIGVLGTAGVAFAATALTPAEIAAGLTGKTVEDVTKERAAGKTYGSIANDAGKLDDFQNQMLKQKKAVLDQRVADGTLTQERADQIYKTIESNQALCDGTGTAGIGRKNGAGFGAGSCVGQGNGMGRGMGNGFGRGLNR